ncbi:hypothetical protein PybrP1_002718, partial [[Pythium] brassicae (nom. inval.)]
MVKTRFVGLFAVVLAVASGLAAAGQDSPVQQQFTPVEQYSQGTVVPIGGDVPTATDDKANATSSDKTVVLTASAPAASPAAVASVSTPAATTATPVAATPAPTTAAPLSTYTPPPMVPSLPNWVGPSFGVPQDTACYRKSHRTKKCPAGYEFDKIATCWAECPVEYPVECGMECIPQNKDCTLQVISKVNAVATKILDQVMNKGENLLDTSTFLSFTKEVGVGESVSALKSPDLSELTKLIESGV